MKRIKTIVKKRNFIKFLKQNNAYGPYMYNFNSLEGIFYKKRYGTSINSKKFFENLSYTDYLLEAFHWSDTYQGYRFWLDLNKEWIETMQNVIKCQQLNKNFFTS